MVSREWDDEFSPEVDRPDNFEDWRSIVDEDLKQSIDVSLSDAMLIFSASIVPSFRIPSLVRTI